MSYTFCGVPINETISTDSFSRPDNRIRQEYSSELLLQTVSCILVVLEITADSELSYRQQL